ncbi:hypothetical protein [Fimbriiglobus ruber]|uniref:hypothetical protein n=1 Tax=Fimbriiglobus ruber TaxID=1908690 RepID=UPI001EE6C723|nr:hypothetical protein [Fimbriiglobus ruber]
MTEAEWLTATDPTPMLEFLSGKASDRKLRLFACACCRRIWHLITEEGSQNAVATAERMSDEQVTDDERWGVMVEAQYMPDNAANAAYNSLCSFPDYPDRTARQATWAVANETEAHQLSEALNPAWEHKRLSECLKQAVDLRDIFGNPFRPSTIDPSCLTSSVHVLATGIYADRTFDRLPILADALQDAGCDNEEILQHCRGPGPHARGCWAVDLLLGKE